MKALKLLLPLFILLSLNCSKKTAKEYPSNKLGKEDAFAETMVKSQFFEIDPKTDNTINGEKGTLILIPEGSLRHKNGDKVEGNVKIELAEALTITDMVLSNLTTTSGGKLLESGGMLYFKATQGEEELKIDPENPIYIQVITASKKPGMMAYQGIRDDKGNMDWVDPKPLENYLIPVDLDLLDFLPEGFHAEVEKGMPYRGHSIATKELADSLYYSLSAGLMTQPVTPPGGAEMNEPHYNKDKEIKDGKYTKESYYKKSALVTETISADTDAKADSAAPCGIDPASIKVIKNKKIQNTIISTREFEKRMAHIHHSCDQKVLDLYVNNLDKNLYVLDSMAAAMNVKEKSVFQSFSAERLTNVENAGKISAKLSEFYNRELRKIKGELERIKNKEMARLAKENQKAEKVRDEYAGVLWKREKYRMDTYGFKWSNSGWINIDTGTVPKDCLESRLEAVLSDTTKYDRIYIYMTMDGIKSMYRLNTDDSKTFYVGNSRDRKFQMPCNKSTFLLTVAYKGPVPYTSTTVFTSTADERVSLNNPELTTESGLKESLRFFDNRAGYTNENSIAKDLVFQEKFYVEKQRQETLAREYQFMQRLWNVAHCCCAGNGLSEMPAETGKVLFAANCASCHSIDGPKSIGPNLAGVTGRRSMDWLIRYTKNNIAMIKAGDPVAVQLFEENNKQNMTTFETLSNAEIQAIYNYIDGKDGHAPSCTVGTPVNPPFIDSYQK